MFAKLFGGLGNKAKASPAPAREEDQDEMCARKSANKAIEE